MENEKKDQSFSSLAILLTVLIVIGTIYFVVNNQKNNEKEVNSFAGVTAPSANAPTAAQPSTAPSADITKVNTVGEAFIGNLNAPVTIASWSDYQCPFCQRFSDDALASVVTDYVNTGKVKLIFKDFSFLGSDSDDAALVARAVWEAAPAKFYEWHVAMFAKQDGENSGWGSKADILALTKTISGIDEAKVESLLNTNSAKYQSAIEADKTEAGNFGISGTPGTIIGQQLIVGAQPYSAVKQLIDLELNK